MPGPAATVTRRTILVAHPSPDLYGSDRVALGTVAALVRHGDRVVVTVPGEGPLVPALEAAGAEVALCPSPVLRKRALRPGGALRLFATAVRSVAPGLRLLRSCGPDLVYVSTLTVPLWLVLARLAGCRCVCHVHEAEPGVPAPVRSALALPLLLAHATAANSEFSRGVLVSAVPRLRARSQVLPNVVAGPPRVTPGRPELTGPLRALYLGRLSPRKGPQVAIAAVDELRSRGLEVRLELLGSTFAGYEWFEDELRAGVARRGLADWVAFLGIRPDIWPVMTGADVVLVPSVADEPFGNAAVEAVLAARPVIASDGGGLREAVAGYRSARLVEPGAPAALADAVEKVVADWPALRLAAVADAAVAAGRHGPALYGDRLERLVLGVLGPSPAAPGAEEADVPARDVRRLPEWPRVVVAVVTFRRPAGLAALLAAVVEQLDDVPGEARVLVVDNDPEGSALAMARAFGARVRFVHEPAAGIAAARNRALDDCGDADVVVFIDDDERPEPGWLGELVGQWRRTGAAAVVGPVISAYPYEPEAWIRRGGFFDRRRLPTGTALSVAATNNLLLDVLAIRRLGLRFDPHLGTSGGSDTLFTRRLHQRGGRIVWCDEARVIDVVPPARLNRHWVLARALRSGNSWSRVALELEGRRPRRALRRLELTARGLVRVAGGLGRMAAGVTLGSMSQRARGARTLARGLGMTGGAWGYTYAEYRRPEVSCPP